MKHLHEVILEGIDVVYNSHIPGRIIVYGENAEPILTGCNVEDVIIAAARLGKGKIMVFSHDIFGLEFGSHEESSMNSPLFSNMKKWLLNKGVSSPCKILKLDDFETIDNTEKLQEYDIVLSLAWREVKPPSLILEYIRNGGSFVHAATPWGWSMLNPEKDISEMPYLKILNEAGITYSLEVSKEVEQNLYCADSKATRAHLGHCLAKENEFKKVVEQVGLLSQVKEVPCLFDTALACKIEKSWVSAYDEAVKLAASGKIETIGEYEKKLLDFCLLGIETLNKKNFKACGIAHFPGDFSVAPPLCCREVKYCSNLQDYFFTSCYVPAGAKVTLKVSKVSNDWFAYVGVHTDHLGDGHLKRWPKIYQKTKISATGEYDMTSPFGGSLYFLSPKEAGSFIEVSVADVVLCPRFDLLDKSHPWEERRNDPGLWADVSGRHVTVTLPSSSVRNLEDPTAAVEMYDRLLEAYHDLRGTDIEAERKMWIVADIQPSAGYMHSGYPIVTHLDVADPKERGFLLNSDGPSETLVHEKWGVFHEIGHNMQLDEWTFDGSSEVTVNIFTLYGMEVIFGVKPWIHPWLMNHFQTAVDYLNAGADFNRWKNDPGLALFFYAQLVRSFGWTAFKGVFRRYAEEEVLPHSDQEKIDTWFLMFSRETKRNLASLAMLWGFPLSAEAESGLVDLNFDHFIPDDELTRKTSDRLELVKNSLKVNWGREDGMNVVRFALAEIYCIIFSHLIVCLHFFREL